MYQVCNISHIFKIDGLSFVQRQVFQIRTDGTDTFVGINRYRWFLGMVNMNLARSSGRSIAGTYEIIHTLRVSYVKCTWQVGMKRFIVKYWLFLPN